MFDDVHANYLVAQKGRLESTGGIHTISLNIHPSQLPEDVAFHTVCAASLSLAVSSEPLKHLPLRAKSRPGART